MKKCDRYTLLLVAEKDELPSQLGNDVSHTDFVLHLGTGAAKELDPTEK